MDDPLARWRLAQKVHYTAQEARRELEGIADAVPSILPEAQAIEDVCLSTARALGTLQARLEHEYGPL